MTYKHEIKKYKSINLETQECVVTFNKRHLSKLNWYDLCI